MALDTNPNMPACCSLVSVQLAAINTRFWCVSPLSGFPPTLILYLPVCVPLSMGMDPLALSFTLCTKQIQEDEPMDFVTYEKFEKKMLEVLREREYEPDTDDTLLRAFRMLDTDKKGYIEAETMREILCTEGTPFRDKEIDGFMSRAKDVETGRIYYEDYVALLMAELDEKDQSDKK